MGSRSHPAVGTEQPLTGPQVVTQMAEANGGAQLQSNSMQYQVAPVRYFCTYFDRNYINRALALYNSLAACEADFHLFALCMDEEAYCCILELALHRMTPVSLACLEKDNPELFAAKKQRSQIEYYYTCGPSFLLYVLYHNPQIDVVTYLDADLFFFSTPEPIFGELAESSVGIVAHRFPVGKESLNRFGTFNVGWVSFRADGAGMACLRWWADRCIEWCYDRVEVNRFADQKYLDEFPQRFESVRVIQHKGANLAPWNLARHAITRSEGRIWVDDQPLIFFHFHGFKVLTSWLFDTNLGGYGWRPSRLVRQHIFGHYIRALTSRHDSYVSAINLRELSRNESRGYGALARSVRRGVQIGLALLRNAYIIDWNAGR